MPPGIASMILRFSSTAARRSMRLSCSGAPAIVHEATPIEASSPDVDGVGVAATQARGQLRPCGHFETALEWLVALRRTTRIVWMCSTLACSAVAVLEACWYDVP